MATYGSDPRGRGYGAVDQYTQRFNQQQGPFAAASMYNYGRGSEADYGNYTDIMNRYRNIAGGQAGTAGASTGGTGTGGTYTPFTVSYSDPFKSYGGFEEFSQTGGYSANDIANMRARGISPIRAAYANAEREIGRQRSLQGGYSPNAIAAQVKMAREQGQSAADATQNVEAGLAQQRQQGRLAGLTGMSGIEGQRLNAQIQTGEFNAQQQAQAQAQNIAAARAAAASGQAAAQQAQQNQMAALRGMTQLYGTTPGMSQTFGNQALGAIQTGGQFGVGMAGNMINAGRNPGMWDQTMGRIGDIGNIAATGVDAFNQYRRRQQQGGGGDYYSAGQPFGGGSTPYVPSTYVPGMDPDNPFLSGGEPSPEQMYNPFMD